MEDGLEDVVADVVGLNDAAGTPDLPDGGVVCTVEISLSSMTSSPFAVNLPMLHLFSLLAADIMLIPCMNEARHAVYTARRSDSMKAALSLTSSFCGKKLIFLCTCSRCPRYADDIRKKWAALGGMSV